MNDDNGYSIVNYADIRSSLGLILSKDHQGGEVDAILSELDETLGNNADELTLERDIAFERFIAATSYDTDGGNVDIRGEGMRIKVSPAMLAMADDSGGIELIEDVLPEPVGVLFDTGPKSPVRIELRAYPIERSQVHDHYDDSDY